MAFVRTGARDDVSWALVLEVWDSPPSWSEVPEVDLQPRLAETALTAFEAVLHRPLDAGAEVLLGEALDAAGEALRARTKETPSVLADGSGAFVAAVLARGSAVAVGWAGRARVYRVREGSLSLVTHDHVLGRRSGTPDALQHVVTRHLATEDGAQVMALDVRVGDRLVAVSSDAAELLATHRAQVVAGSAREVVTALLAAWPEPLASAGVAVADVMGR
jgi:hypothetical protein